MSDSQTATLAICSQKGGIDSKLGNELSKEVTIWKILTLVITLFDLGDSNETIETIINLADSVLPNVYFTPIAP